MLVKLKGSPSLWILTLSITLGVIIGIYPGTGGEGSQREITSLQNKSDWWNFSTAFIYGSWPTIFNNWQFTLTIVQLACYLIGVIFFYKSLSEKFFRNIFLFPAIIGGYFVIQLWRDATLLSFSILALSILTNLEDKSSSQKIIRFSVSSVLLALSCLFKPIFGPVLFLILFLMFKDHILNKFLKIVLFICISLFSISPYFLDKHLGSMAGLDRSYPEQQVFIYDLSKMYCWGYSPSVIEKSKIALKPLLIAGRDGEEICASLSPTGWDSLRVSTPEVRDSPALRVLVDNEGSALKKLRSDWMNIILHSPMEWLMVKISDFAQVLTMANAFYMPGIFQNSASSNIFLIGDILLRILLVPIQILDKFRIFSLSATLFVGFALLLWNKGRFPSSKSRQSIISNFILVNLLTTCIGTLAYIANNGRYIMPYLLVSYFYLIWGIGSKKALKV